MTRSLSGNARRIEFEPGHNKQSPPYDRVVWIQMPPFAVAPRMLSNTWGSKLLRDSPTRTRSLLRFGSEAYLGDVGLLQGVEDTNHALVIDICSAFDDDR